MKFATYRTSPMQDDWLFGLVTDEGLLPLSELAGSPVKTVHQLIEGGKPLQEALTAFIDNLGRDQSLSYLSEKDVQFGPCVTDPEKIICVGLNYRKHAAETNAPVPEIPILFSKFNNALASPGEDIPLPPASEQVDYEAELVIVIGKEAVNVSRDDALDYVFGYCNANDLSARDLQLRTPQWLLGKSCDKFCPIGPYLVTSDEIGNPNDLGIRAYVNGDIRQNSNTSDMVFHCADIVSYISQHMTLKPGDMILTGTPEGVVLGYPEDERVWLKDGDEVTIEIDKLGKLTNKMVNP